MQAVLKGEVVDLDRNEWDFNGRQGVAYGAFVSGSRRDQPQRVRLTSEQYETVSIGAQVEWPVAIVALESNYGAPKLRVTLDPEFVIADAAPASSGKGSKAGTSLSLEPEPAF